MTGFGLCVAMYSETIFVCIVFFFLKSGVIWSVLLWFRLMVFLFQFRKIVSFISLSVVSGWVRSCKGCVARRAFCLSCDACSLRWYSSGSVFVSMCRCWMSVSWVHPVMILKALFWIVCSFCRLDFFIIGDHTVLAYSMTGRMTVSYVLCKVSFCFYPNLFSSKIARLFPGETCFTRSIAINIHTY